MLVSCAVVSVEPAVVLQRAPVLAAVFSAQDDDPGAKARPPSAIICGAAHSIHADPVDCRPALSLGRR